ncbi:MAG: hypothetical protein CBC83_07200, partial [Flavobacteriales bacterium TMED123]
MIVTECSVLKDLQAHNLKVVGSNPTAETSYFNDLEEFLGHFFWKKTKIEPLFVKNCKFQGVPFHVIYPPFLRFE